MNMPTSKIVALCLVAALPLALANRANAQNYGPPPSGGEQIFALTGDPVDTNVDAYSASFTATSTTSFLTFVFRHDPGYFALSNVDLWDATTSSANLLVNGDFMADGPTTAGAGLTGWTYFYQAGNDFPEFFGYEDGAGNYWDGSTQAYDGIVQSFSTNAGDTYNLTFDLYNDDSDVTAYQPISTNGDTTDTGGNGVDVFAYAGNAIPSNSVPDETSTFALLAVAVGLLSLPRLRRAVVR